MTDAPQPLTPADCDLRGMPFMPLDVVRLGDSDLFAISTGDEFKAAVTLWCKSWLQVPAASLPNDDRILAHLSSAGPAWGKLKAVALRGWVLCSDGRLYHRVIAEKALEAWRHRQMQRERAGKRWEKSAGKTTGDAAAHATGDAAAHATAMQGTGTVKKDSPCGPPPADDAPRKASPTRQADAQGSRLPEDWQPSHEDAAFATSLHLDPEQVAAEFRDYWCAVPGTKGRKTNWSRTFRNRCRDRAGRQPALPVRQAGRSYAGCL